MKFIFSAISLMWVCIVTILSLMPPVYTDTSLFPNSDKVVHFFMYAIMAVFFLSRMLFSKGITPKMIILVTIISSIVLGGMLELAQEFFTASREASIGDFLANSLGAVFATYIYRRWLWNSACRNFATST